MAVVVGLVLAASTGCYDELDYNRIACDVNTGGSCPGGYVCSAGLCVKATTITADAAAVDSAVVPVYDGATVEQDVGGTDGVVGEVAATVDVAPLADASDSADARGTIDSLQDSTRTADGGGEDLIVALDAADDVANTDIAVWDGSPVDAGRDASDAAPDVPTIGTEIRTIESFRIPTADVVPTSIISGPDGNLWFAEYKTKNIGRVTPAGQVKEFPTPTGVNDLTVGADNNIWYASADGGSIGRFNLGFAHVECDVEAKSRHECRKHLKTRPGASIDVRCDANTSTHARHQEGAPRFAWRQARRWQRARLPNSAS